MEILIVRGLSSILEAGLWTYFIVSVSKIISKEDENLKKGKIFILFFIVLLCSIIGRLTANIFPFLNTLITYPIVLIATKFILKIDWLKSLTIVVINLVTLMITELISVFTCISIFKISSEIFVNSWEYLSIALVIQYTLFFAIIKIANMISKNKSEFKDMLSSINKKTVITVLSILALCIFPQVIIYVINKYNYPTYFLILNSIQMIIVCIVIFSSFKNSMEKEKAKSDLMTITLHNKTMTGMVDGVRKLKHDYNNIMQALNGYMSTKQYDKLQAHINSVIGECSDINNL
jgi:two-component system sensor histidine kinase AgrC